MRTFDKEKILLCKEYFSVHNMVVTVHIFWIYLHFSVLELYAQLDTNIIPTFRVWQEIQVFKALKENLAPW